MKCAYKKGKFVTPYKLAKKATTEEKNISGMKSEIEIIKDLFGPRC